MVWIFGDPLGSNCSAPNLMDRRTYPLELCGMRVLVGGVAARLIFAAQPQLNRLLPDEPWEDRNVNF